VVKSWRAAWLPAAILVICLALAACGSAPATATATPSNATLSPGALQAELSALTPGNTASGKALFSAVGCVACHSLEAGVRVVGPSLSGAATRAATRKAGYSAQLYLYESITQPNAYVVEGFPSGVMPQDFTTRLKAQDLADLIAFLMTEQ
jgi:cytochrome c